MTEETEMADETETLTATLTTGPLPGSRKVYAEGRLHPGLRVPMREIALTPTLDRRGGEVRVIGENAPLAVYDTSGPYTDPTAVIDVRAGLVPVRSQWIVDRGDSEEVA